MRTHSRFIPAQPDDPDDIRLSVYGMRVHSNWDAGENIVLESPDTILEGSVIKRERARIGINKKTPQNSDRVRLGALERKAESHYKVNQQQKKKRQPPKDSAES